MAGVPLTEFGPPNNTTTTALAASSIAKAATGILYGFTVTNTSASAQYIQMHDSATLPADAVVPIASYPVPALSALTVDFGEHGREFVSGIVLCNSSAIATKVIGSANCLFDSQVQ